MASELIIRIISVCANQGGWEDYQRRKMTHFLKITGNVYRSYYGIFDLVKEICDCFFWRVDSTVEHKIELKREYQYYGYVRKSVEKQ